jgi:hypothetical protein
MASLSALAEVSIGLAGFAAIVVVLGPRASRFDAETTAMIRAMISMAVGCAFSCLLGIAVLALGLSPPLAWRVSSALVSVILVAVWILNYFLFLRDIEGFWTRSLLFQAFVLLSLGLHLSNALGFPVVPSFGIFYSAVVALLATAGLGFVYSVYVLLSRPDA